MQHLFERQGLMEKLCGEPGTPLQTGQWVSSVAEAMWDYVNVRQGGHNRMDMRLEWESGCLALWALVTMASRSQSSE